MRLPLFLPALGLAVGLAACSRDAPPAPSSRPASDALRHGLLEVPDDGQRSLRADIEIPLGRVVLGEAEAGALFQAETRLPAGGIQPRLRVETEPAESGPRAVITFGAEGETASVGDLRTLGDQATWRLLFGHRRPLDLALSLGVAQGDLDLTGLPLTRLAVRSGAGRTRLVFRGRNPVAMREFEIQAGVRAFAADGLGWARFDRLTFDGGVGRFALDFSGDALAPGATATLRVGVASLEVVLPRGHPTVVSIADAPGLSVRPPPGFVVVQAPPGENRFATPDAGDDALQIRVESGPGRVRFRVAERRGR